MKILPFISGFVLFMACRSPAPTVQEIRIDGDVPALPDGMVYLVKAGAWRRPLDSTLCAKGKFVFRLPADSSYIPFDAAIHYYPQGDRDHPVRLRFQNPFHTEKPGVMLDHFWLEAGTTTIRALSPPNLLTRIEAGPETRLMFRHQFSDIGWAGDADTVQRKEKIDRLEKEIRANPSSWFLLESLSRFKEQYSGKEISRILNAFSPALIRSETGIMLLRYLYLQVPEGQPYPFFRFPAAGGDTLSLFPSGARIHMLVFWASWCQPCRQEIPLLKQLHERYASRGLSLTSLSIDTDTTRWKLAIREEQMPWQQLRVPENRIPDLQSVFRFTTIPFLVFTDAQGREIARFADYNPAALESYESVIRPHIP